MRKLLTLAFLLLAILAPGLHADIYKEARSGLEFPETIGDFERMEVKPYEYEPGKQGVAISYGYQDTAVTIYVRATPAEMADLTSADFVQETVAQVMEMEKLGHFANVKFFDFQAAREKPGWSTKMFTGETQGLEVDSFIACKAMPGYMVKIRATTAKGGGGDFLAFLAGLKETLNKSAR